MPVKTTHEELKVIEEALELHEVNSHLDEYALGQLYYYQHKFLKANRNAQRDINEQLKLLDTASPAYQELKDRLNVLKAQPDLGFYYTIFLLDKLETKPKQVNEMIRAILSFDTMGRYLSEKQLIILNETVGDEVPPRVNEVHFDLDAVLQRHGIDTTALKTVASQNRLNTPHVRDDIAPIGGAGLLPPAISFPANFDTFSDAPKKAWRELVGQATFARDNDLLRKRMGQAPFDFALLSQKPTEQNIRQFLSTVAEMFDHARMQDTAKLYTLNAAALPDDKSSAYSTVALLQNSLHLWLILSLVQATTTETFDKRLQFIMAAFAAANRTLPPILANATADMYLPLFMLASVLKQSVLQFHSAVLPHLHIVEDMSSRRSGAAITRYTDHIHIKVPGRIRARSLPPMRMDCAMRLELNSEHASMATKHTIKGDAHEVLMRGKLIYNYFNPKHLLCSRPLRPISASARALFDVQSLVRVLFENVNHFDVLELIASVYVVHRPTEGVGKQLKALENGLSICPPQVFYHQAGSRALLRLSGSEALGYIESHVKKIASDSQGVELLGSEYITAVGNWCSTILEKVNQKKSLLEAETVEAAGETALGAEEVGAETAPTAAAAARGPLHSLSMFFRHRGWSSPPRLGGEAAIAASRYQHD